MNKSKVLKTTYNSVFIVISLILGFFGRLSILPVFPFLKLDFSDIPIFLVTIILGVSSGLTVLLVSSFLRSLMFSSAGWMGFLIRASSLVMIFFIACCIKDKVRARKIFKLFIGVILCITIKLILNYFIWIRFFGLSHEAINSIMFSILIPYNILKIVVNLVFSFLLVKPVNEILKKSQM